jgi:hypothetical protein
MSEYVDDEFPLPRFSEIFGDGTSIQAKKYKKNDVSDAGGGEESTGFVIFFVYL